MTKARTDVKIQVDQWAMSPFMGLGSWAAFTPSAHGGAMVMGDTVVFEDEVNPAMRAALDAGLEVTALHNHFFFDRAESVLHAHRRHRRCRQARRRGEEGLRQNREIRAANSDSGQGVRRELPQPARSPPHR